MIHKIYDFTLNKQNKTILNNREKHFQTEMKNSTSSNLRRPKNKEQLFVTQLLNYRQLHKLFKDASKYEKFYND